MTATPLVNRSNPGAFPVSGEPRLVNCYAQEGGSDQKAPITLIPCAGQKRFSTTAGAPCRGMIFVEEEDRIYSANGFGLFAIEADGTKTNIKLISGSNNVYFARNDTLEVETMMVSDSKAYVIKNNVATYKAYDFIPDGVTFCGGYFVFWIADGENQGRFYASDLSSTDVDPLSFATAEGDPDGLTKAHGSINTLYLIGKRTTEIWSISGGGDFPFTKAGAHMRFGSNSPHTVQDFNNGVVWVGNDNVVYYVFGYQEQPISSNEVSRLIEAEADKSTLVAFTYQRGNDKFYCLQGTGWTREFNSRTGAWHDRRTGPFDQWNSIHHVKAWGRDIFGSRSDGQFSENDVTLYTENGGAFVSGFDLYDLHAFPKGLSHQKFEILAETGHGNATTPDPKMMVSWSDDGGRTFSPERLPSLGGKAEYNKTMKLHRLGISRRAGRMYRVRISDPVPRAIALMDVTAGRVSL